MCTADASSSEPGLVKLAIIAAMTRDRVIGAGGKLPWHLPQDLQLFKRLTAGGSLIMGRKTHIAIGRPLPSRPNIVLSRSGGELPGVQLCTSFPAALAAARQYHRPVFVIGGAQLYRLALPLAEELHISWVTGAYTGDTFFPPFAMTDWQCCEEADFQGFHYTHYRRRR